MKSDIIAKHTSVDPWDIFSLNTCNAWFAADADCAAKGIFYSGGHTTGHENEVSMFSSDGGDVSIGAADNKEFTSTCLNPHEPDFLTVDPLAGIQCWLNKTPLVCSWMGNCDKSEFNIRGFVFAGQVGAMPMTYFRLDQDSSVLHKAVERRYYRSLSGTPVDWMEIDPPANIPKLAN